MSLKEELMEELRKRETVKTEEFERVGKELDDIKISLQVAKDKKKYAVEKKCDGFRAIIHREGSNVKIYDSQTKDITSKFPDAIRQIAGLSKEDFVLDTEFVFENDEVVFYVFDCLHLGESLINSPWHTRKKALHSLEFSNNIKETPSMVVDNKTDAKKAVEMFSKITGSEGVMIKNYDGVYCLDKGSKDWIDYGLLQNLKVLAYKVDKTGNCSVGCIVSSEEVKDIKPSLLLKYNDSYLQSLGEVPCAHVKVTSGDVLLLGVEEVIKNKHDNDKISYSISNPKVVGKEDGDVVTLEELNEITVNDFEKED